MIARLLALLVGLLFATTALADQCIAVGPEGWVKVFDSPCVSAETIARIPEDQREGWSKAQGYVRGERFLVVGQFERESVTCPITHRLPRESPGVRLFGSAYSAGRVNRWPGTCVSSTCKSAPRPTRRCRTTRDNNNKESRGGSHSAIADSACCASSANRRCDGVTFL